MILGTAAYMSPEQARGKPVDKRTDIWAFGCLLYEMLTGERAFKGENIADTLAAVVTQEPDWRVLPAQTPANVRTLLRRCLQKDRTERLHDIGDARLELKESPAPAPLPDGRPRVSPWIAAALFAAVALSVSLIHFRETAPEQPMVRLSLPPPEKTSFGEVAVSPDGRRVAFTSRDAAGKVQLWVRPLDAVSAQALAGTEGAMYPFWSPDGRGIGFFAEGKLKKVEVTGGPPQIIALAAYPRGGAWNRNGVIVFAPDSTGPLVQVLASGGEPKPATELDASHQEGSHRFPQWLPDGRRFLYLVLSGQGHTGVYAGSLDSMKKTRVLVSTGSAVYGIGHLLFVRQRALLAQGFDAEKLQLTGEAFSVAEPVGVDYPARRVRVSLSETGVLVHDLGNRGASWRLLWVDRKGRTVQTVGPPGDYLNVDLSPDGHRLAADPPDLQTGSSDIWIFDLTRGASTRFTVHPSVDALPVWSPDGRRIAFSSFRGGTLNLYQKDASGVGEEELLLKTPLNKHPTSWSSDGRWLLYQEEYPKMGVDLWALSLDRREPVPWLRTEFHERQGRFSPDDHWVAYDSNESGQFEVYVRPFSAGGAATASRWQVSTSGGQQPRWRGDGRELFYLGPDRRLMAAEVKTVGGQLEVGTPKALFPTSAAIARDAPTMVYAAAADGQRFVIISEGEEAASPPATVVMNWTAGLKK